MTLIAVLGLILGALTSWTASSADASTVRLYDPTTVPGDPAENDPHGVELGVKFSVSTAASVTGVAFYKSTKNTGVHTGTLWSAGGTMLATGTFSAESASGWQTLTFDAPVALDVDTTYVASYHTASGYYSQQIAAFANGATIVDGPLTATAGVYSYGKGYFPTHNWYSSSYYVDVLLQVGQPGSTSDSPTPTPSDSSSDSSSPSSSPTSSTPSSSSGSSAPTSSSSSAAPTSSSSSAPSTSASATPTKSSTPTATPTTSAPSGSFPGSALNCISNPSACGYPDATNTGVPSGVTLTTYTGPRTITTNGTVIDGALINGQITINADNVIIRNSKVISQAGTDCGTASCAAILYLNASTGGGVYNSDILGNGGYCTIGVEARGDNTVQGNDISGCGDGVRQAGVMIGNYVHDLWTTGRVNGVCTDTPHNDGYQTGGISNAVIRNNTIIIPPGDESQNCSGAGVDSCVYFGDQFESSDNGLVTDNLFRCDSYMVRLSPSSTNMKVTNNRFSKVPGGYGPFLKYATTPAFIFSGNIWDDTGLPVTV